MSSQCRVTAADPIGVIQSTPLQHGPTNAMVAVPPPPAPTRGRTRGRARRGAGCGAWCRARCGAWSRARGGEGRARSGDWARRLEPRSARRMAPSLRPCPRTPRRAMAMTTNRVGPTSGRPPLNAHRRILLHSTWPGQSPRSVRRVRASVAPDPRCDESHWAGRHDPWSRRRSVHGAGRGLPDGPDPQAVPRIALVGPGKEQGRQIRFVAAH